MKSNERKGYLKAFWLLILLTSICQVLFVDGYIGLKEAFDWNFLHQPKSYLKLLFYTIWWTAFYYLFFWSPTRKKQAKEKPQSPEVS